MTESESVKSNLNSKADTLLGCAMDILLDIELPVTLRFGRRQMSLNDILSLDTGSLVEFDRATDDPIEVLVNDRVVARGEAVTVHGHYGVRILEVVGSKERLNSPSYPVVPAQASAATAEG